MTSKPRFALAVLFALLMMITSTSASIFAQQKLPKGAQKLDDAKLQELVSRIKSLRGKTPSKTLTVDQAGNVRVPMGIQPINPSLANVAITQHNGEVIARVNLADLPSETIMMTFKNSNGIEEHQIGIFFSEGGCRGCAFDVEPGDKTSFLDQFGIVEYGAYFFIGQNVFVVTGQAGINGALPFRFLRGNPQEVGRTIEIHGDGSFAPPVVVSLRHKDGFTFMVNESPALQVTPTKLTIDLNHPDLVFLPQGNYEIAVANGIYSNTASGYLHLDGVPTGPQTIATPPISIGRKKGTN